MPLSKKTSQAGFLKRTGQKSKLMLLPDRQRKQLITWLCEDDLTYKETLKRLKQKFGVTASLASLCKFWQRVCAPAIAAKNSADAVLEIDFRLRQGEAVTQAAQLSITLTPGNPGKFTFQVNTLK